MSDEKTTVEHDEQLSHGGMLGMQLIDAFGLPRGMLCRSIKLELHAETERSAILKIEYVIRKGESEKVIDILKQYRVVPR